MKFQYKAVLKNGWMDGFSPLTEGYDQVVYVELHVAKSKDMLYFVENKQNKTKTNKQTKT